MVSRVLGHKLSQECGSGGDLAIGPLGKEIQIEHGLVNFFTWPLHKAHIVLAKTDKAFRNTDALVTAQYLPDIYLFISSLVPCLLFLLTFLIGF